MVGDGTLSNTKKSNRINWPESIIEAAKQLGYYPFFGYWVKVGDARLYLIDEILRKDQLESIT